MARRRSSAGGRVKLVTPESRAMSGYLGKIARAMSRNWGVDVIFDGLKCSTDGNIVYIPYNSEYLGDDKKQLIHSNLDHEVCHVAEERVAKDAGRTTPIRLMNMEPDRTVRMLFNVYEDIRIELKYSAEYPGMSENLSAGNTHAAEMFAMRHGPGSRNFWHWLGCAIICRVRGVEVEEWCPKSMLPWLDLLAPELEASKHCDWAEDAMELAHATHAKVKAVSEALKSRDEEAGDEEGGDKSPLAVPPEASDKAKGDEPEDGEGDGDGDVPDFEPDASESESKDEPEDGEGEDEAGEPEDAEPEDAEPEDGAGKGEASDGADDGEPEGDAGKGEATSGDDAGESPDSESTGDEAEGGEFGPEGSGTGGTETDEALKDAIDEGMDPDAAAETDDITAEESKREIEESAMKDVETHHRYIPNPESRTLDKWFKPDGGSLRHYEAALDSVREQVAVLRAKTLSVVRVMALSRTVGDRESGDLDSASLHTLKQGNKRIFSHTIKGRELDVAVEILVDLSGSMGSNDHNESPAWYAHRTTIALAETFDRLGIPCEIIGFTNSWAPGRAPHSRLKGYQNRPGFDFRIFKDFREPLRKCRTRFQAMTGYADNADGEALHEAAKRLSFRTEERKLLWVISDGHPQCNGVGISAGPSHLKNVVKMITKAGIEVFGIGCATDAVRSYYNDSTGASNIVITDLDQLATTIYKEMRHKILKQGRRAA